MRRSRVARLGLGVLAAVCVVPLLGCVAAPPPVIGPAMAGDGQATVSWSPPPGDTAAAVQSYVVTPYVGWTAQSPTTVGSNVTSTVITGLTNGTTYSFYVRANMGNGDTTATSRRSNPVTPLDSGLAYSWGENFLGQLGDGTTNPHSAPAQIGVDTDWAALSGGEAHAVALKADGSLWAWGLNNEGQLGDGTTTNRTTPIQIGVETDWARIDAGAFHTLAIKDDGTLWGWGADGTGVGHLTPTQIGTATNWTAISASWGSHSLAIKADGTLWAWGFNNFGQLGDGTTTGRGAPVQIGTATNWTSVAGSAMSSLGVRSDGSLWSWGYPLNGTFPEDEGDPPPTWPPPSGGGSGWASVEAGWMHWAGLKTDGSLWIWGYGQSSMSSPQNVGGTDWVAVALGSGQTVALKEDGTLWALGTGLPTLTGSGSDWVGVAAGGAFTMALQEP